ncbi:hypothetical protein EYM_04765 [Ignicoccus islandicus DSM 13165]|uniref:Uncharacterized protein n=1 Tax=Ignicoccus islandicus DSM 13165 TaxID=940295 RepID=A0A0U2U8W5_9CREN|nr:hypothetical protein [Ignicoccus islandicus]ALU12516.1 hypothetical protein EYM_04765 [Ignicoccus islandicus DSM 13165]
MSRPLLLLYITPQNLFKTNKILEMQWSATKTLTPCIMKILYEGDIDKRLHIFDEIFTGLKNLEDIDENDVLGRVSISWYYITKLLHQSIGPRLGKFTEKIIQHWINTNGIFEVLGTDVPLGSILREYFKVRYNSRKKIDFVIRRRSNMSYKKEWNFIELRTSEHTGGRTAQLSLLDKFNDLLRLLEIDGYYTKIINVAESIYMDIAILFSEQHELLNNYNFSKGRLSSLISYIVQEDQILGKVEKLLNKGFELFDKYCKEHVDRESLQTVLNKERGFCLKDGKISIIFRILFGDEFFRYYTGKTINQLLSEDRNIADDLWFYFGIVLNELKVAKVFGRTNVRLIYDIIKENDMAKSFKDIYNICTGKHSSQCSLEKYVREVNDIVQQLAIGLLNHLEQKNLPLRLLETNDHVKNWIYLKRLVYASLSLYLTRDLVGDTHFKQCKWS